jgi:hypothetical protein
MLRRLHSLIARRQPLVSHRRLGRAFLLLSSLFLSLCSITASATSLEPCTGDTLHAYKKCVRRHSCECAHCDPDPTDKVPAVYIDKPEECRDIMSVLCPMIRCCTPCADVAEIFYTCTSDALSGLFFDATCPLMCKGYPYTDSNCHPTNAPTPYPTMHTEAPAVLPTAAPTHRKKEKQYAKQQQQVEPVSKAQEPETSSQEAPREVVVSAATAEQAASSSSPWTLHVTLLCVIYSSWSLWSSL